MCCSSGLTRRQIIGGALASGLGAALAGCAGIRRREPGEPDARVPALLADTISVDFHTHAAGASRAPAPRYDLADHLRRGRLSAVCLCHSADGPVIGRPPDGGRMRQYRDPSSGELHEHTQRRLDFMDDMVNRHGMTRVLTAADLQAAKAAGRPALIGTIEGCQFMDGRLDRVKEVYDRGVRHLQLVHYMLSDLGDEQTEDPRWGGLSPLGAEVIRECNRLGIVVDVAHGTQALVEQAARVSRTPLVLSHTALARGPLNPRTRLISEAHARLIGEMGGVIGVWANAASFVDRREWVDGIARMVDVVGVDSVGVGTDMEGVTRAVWDDYADLPTVADLLLTRGFSPAEASKLLGGNYVRVFSQAVAAR